jgi:hypothetical protein
MSSPALFSESCVRFPPPLSESALDVIELFQVVMAEHTPSAQSAVDCRLGARRTGRPNQPEPLARKGGGWAKGPYAHEVIFYGVVSAQTEKVVEFFLEREAASFAS